MNGFVSGRAIYLSWIWTMARPGKKPCLLADIDQTDVRDVDEWPEGDMRILLEEGRRFQDSSATSLDTIRTRAQLTATTSLALLGFLGAQLHTTLERLSNWALAILSFGGLCGVAAILGAISLVIVHVYAPAIHPGVLTSYETPVMARLSHDYALNAKDWSLLLGTMRTVLREANLYFTLAALIGAYIYTRTHI